VKSSLETLEGNKVKLSVNVEEAEFDKDIDQAFRKIAQEVRLPGFRNGKAPRRVLEARIGLGPAREQALRDSIPLYLAKAVREHDVDLIASPEVEITGGAEEGPIEFDATCEVRPEITVPGYETLQVELPAPEASDAEVEEAITAQLKRHGALTPTERPAATGDFVTVDLAATRDGEEVTGLNTEDWSYEIGQGWVADDFDEQLIGSTPGDVLTFTTTPKGTPDPADFVVTVGAVQELALPEVTDEWVADNLGEFDTVDEWRRSVRDGLTQNKLNQVRQELVGRVTEALTGLTEIEAPEALVQGDLQRRVEATVRQLQSQGISMDQWFSVTGQDAASFVEGMKGASEQAVKVDLALRAVAVAEGLDADEGDLDLEYQRMAMQVDQKPNQVRKAYEQNDLVPELVAQIRKSKALDWLIHHVQMVDAEGNTLDRDVVLGHTHDADGNHIDDHDHGDHDHDHEGHDHGADVGAIVDAAVQAADTTHSDSDSTEAASA
jgi:trigger factor